MSAQEHDPHAECRIERGDGKITIVCRSGDDSDCPLETMFPGDPIDPPDFYVSRSISAIVLLAFFAWVVVYCARLCR